MPGESVPQGLWLPPRVATLVVAALNSTDRDRAQADYLCDGVNDHLEIQAALDALPATGGEVKLLDGTYYIEVSLALDSYQTLRGCGRNTILTTTTADLDIITATGTSGNEKVGILIADLCVDGAAGGVASGHAINWTYVDYSKIINVWGEGNGGDNIYLENCDFNQIYGNTCQTSEEGIHVCTCTNISIIGNICEGNYYDGIYVDGSDNNIVSGNICRANGDDGILVSLSSYNTISGNICQGNEDRGIAVKYNNNTISGNTCLGNSQAIDNTEANILVEGDYNLVACNLCRMGDLAPQAKYGIYISAGIKNIVQGNDLYDSGETANFNDIGTLTMVRDDNRDIDVIQVRHYVYVKNTSGTPRVAGDVVIIKGVATDIEFTTTNIQGDDKVYGMVAEAIANNDYGYVLVKGFTDALKVDGTIDIAIDDILGTFTTPCIAMKAAAGDQGFALALAGYATDNSSGVINAYIKSPWD